MRPSFWPCNCSSKLCNCKRSRLNWPPRIRARANLSADEAAAVVVAAVVIVAVGAALGPTVPPLGPTAAALGPTAAALGPTAAALGPIAAALDPTALGPTVPPLGPTAAALVAIVTHSAGHVPVKRMEEVKQSLKCEVAAVAVAVIRWWKRSRLLPSPCPKSAFPHIGATAPAPVAVAVAIPAQRPQ